MIRKTIKISNKLGLHARPATLIVKTATKYRSDCRLVKDDMDINGKSIMGVMMLAAEYGSEIELITDGIDEDYLMTDLVELFKSKFDEE